MSDDLDHHVNVEAVNQDESIEPLRPDDIALVIRDGGPILRTPHHDMGTEVPDDVMVVIGMALMWQHAEFRAHMQRIVNAAAKRGELDGFLFVPPDERPN